MKKLLFCLIIFSNSLFAEVTESYSKKTVQVGEESYLEIKFQAGDVAEWNLPEKGFIFSELDSETPIGELKEIVQTATDLKLTYVYYMAGNFKAKVSWKSARGEIFPSQESLEVKTVLTGEKEALDIVEPFVFSGSYLARLILILVVGICLITGLAYVIFYFKNKKKKSPKDALFTKIETGEDPHFYKSKLQNMLLSSELSHKEFIFLLSGYIKERIGAKLDTSVLHLTQSEIHEILQTKYQVANVELLTIDNYFNSVKYMPNEEKITRDNALGLIKYWDRILMR